jgi:hypothetical protein
MCLCCLVRVKTLAFNTCFVKSGRIFRLIRSCCGCQSCSFIVGRLYCVGPVCVGRVVMSCAIPPLSVRLRGVVLNLLSVEKTASLHY